jgi:hypothetical protein
VSTRKDSVVTMTMNGRTMWWTRLGWVDHADLAEKVSKEQAEAKAKRLPATFNPKAVKV